MSEYASFQMSPFTDIDCQTLLGRHDTGHSGWLRKQSFRNKLKIFAWPQVYVVLSGGCIYYFGSEIAKRSHSFSLYGYNFVMRDSECQDALWVFKVIHAYPEFKTFYFSASSEQEMKEWMKKVKYEMNIANKKHTKTRQKPDGKAFDEESLTYQDIEQKIYEDSSTFMVPQNYKNKRNSDADSDEDMDGRPPAAPPLPPRSGEKGHRRRRKRSVEPVATAQITRELQDRLTIQNRENATNVRERRQKPDGASMIEKAPEEPSEMSQEEYWASIYFDDSDTRDASDVLRAIGEDGVYLVRKRIDGSLVLGFYGGNMPRKMIISEKDDKYFLSASFSADSVEELVYYYYENEMPVKAAKVKLETPYKLHPKYHSV